MAGFFEMNSVNTRHSQAQIMEFAGRLCYNSLDKIGVDSYKKFLSSISKNEHHSVLAHSNTVISIKVGEGEEELLMRNLLQLLEITRYIRFKFYNNNLYLAFNARVIVDLLNKYNELDDNTLFKYYVMKAVQISFPFEAFSTSEIEPWKYDETPIYDLPKSLDLLIKESPYILYVDETDDIPEQVKDDMLTITFNTSGINRAISQQLMRHNTDTAYSQLSQRYTDIENGCNDFVIKDDLDTTNNIAYIHSIDKAMSFDDMFNIVVNEFYPSLRQAGWKKEEARNILPNGLRTSVTATMTRKQLRHVFYERLVKPGAQYDIRLELMKLLIKLQTGYGLFTEFEIDSDKIICEYKG